MYVGSNSVRKRERRFCKQCGKPYIWLLSNASDYCSKKCKILANKITDGENNKPEKGKQQYRSAKNSKKIQHSNCAYCGKIYDLSLKTSHSKYCSTLCRFLAGDKEEKIEREWRKCRYCQKEFECPSLSERKFCSEKCEKAMNGEILLKDNSSKEESQHHNDSISKEKKETPKKKYSYNDTEIRICKNCGKSFTWFPAKPYGCFCSEKCKRESDESKKTQKEHLNNPADEALYEFVEEKVTYLVKQLFLCGDSYNGRCLDYWKIGTISEKTREQVLERDKYECQVCGRTDHLHIHHIIKRRNGGNHDPENLITLCASCHSHIETGDIYHAVKKCFDNAKLYYNMGQKSSPSYAGSVKGDLEEIFSDIEKINEQEFQEILIELDEIIESL